MAEDPAQRDTPNDSRHTNEELAQLREILVGPERKELARLQSSVDRLGFTAERLADELPQAIFRRNDRGDRQLAVALAPSVERALAESVRKHPSAIATAIFPVLGPAIRKAIAEAMAGLVASVNAGIGRTLSWEGLRWRFESWRTGVPFAQVVISHSMLYRVEQVLLVHAETGLLLAHVSSPDLVTTDGDLISGMMTAIRDFVADSFAKEREVGGLTSFTVGELEVIVEPGPMATIAAVVRGPAPPAVAQKLRETIELIHLRFADALLAFQGDATRIEPARELLEDNLETVLRPERTARAGKRAAALLPWAFVFGVLLLAVGVVLWQRASAWQRAVSRLEAEPGIVVVRADRGWRRWRFSGLRDPLAARPSVVLAALGTDTTRVDERWQPYVSLDSSIVVERSRRQLSAPTTVKLALDHDTLRAAGAAPLSWVVGASELRMFPPGVSYADLDDVEAELPEVMMNDLASVQRRRVLFAVASSRLSIQAQAAIDSTANELINIDAALGPASRHVEIELAGRADPTGMDAVNQSLSAERAAIVKLALIGSGVPESSISTKAFGASAPLTVNDSTARARVNRSVSFVVKVVRNERSTTPPR